MSILKELDELKAAGVVSEEAAQNIRNYYLSRQKHSSNKFIIVFSILGAILVGLGIILIIAHNWDDLSKNTKVFFSFLPLVLGQLLCGYTLFKRAKDTAWREGSSAFLFFGVGASISLISQVYNIHGNLETFLLTWMLLCLPLVYLMRSSIVALLFLAGITYYNSVTNDYVNIFGTAESGYNYWWLLLLVLPHYYLLLKNKPDSNFTVFHNWFIPISLTICLGSMAETHGNLMYMAYMSLFGLFYLLGTSPFFQRMKRNITGYLVIGNLGSVQILLAASFNWFWKDIGNDNYAFSGILASPEFLFILFFTALATVTLIRLNKSEPREFHPLKFIFLLFIFLFFLGISLPIMAIVIINFVVLANGILTVRHGLKHDHLGILNYGLLTITALVVCRFFDSDMSFIVRGLLFMLVGAGFFASNYFMIKKRKKQLAAENG